MASERASEQVFLGVSALLFAASAALTIHWCASMAAMREMPMPGGWTMSMAWMRMPGQTWPGAAASFLGMWVVMMVAMMLPCLIPMLRRYRQALGRTGEARLGRLTALVGAGYFFVWTVLGAVAFPLGVTLAAIEMRQPALARAVPLAAGVAVLIAGSLQLTAWKARRLACCREVPGRGHARPADAGTAWRHGVRLGLHCGHCCANLMVILLVLGIMDLGAMAVVTAAITAERLAPAGERVARAVGAVTLGAGLLLIARAADHHCYATFSGLIFSTCALIALAASHRSTARCALSQNSGELLNRRERRSAIPGLTALRSRSNSFTVCLETPNASASSETVIP
jgi:predicted metal-binding membrane protein